MATVNIEIPPRRRRSEAMVEIWRTEVAVATGTANSPLASPASESPISWKSRPTSPESSSGRRKSFISFTKVKTAEHVPPPLEQPGLLARVKMGLKSIKPRGIEKTGMYHADIGGGETIKANGMGQGDDEVAEKVEEKVVDITSLSDLSREKGGLLAKREGLERTGEQLRREERVLGGEQ